MYSFFFPFLIIFAATSRSLDSRWARFSGLQRDPTDVSSSLRRNEGSSCRSIAFIWVAAVRRTFIARRPLGRRLVSAFLWGERSTSRGSSERSSPSSRMTQLVDPETPDVASFRRVRFEISCKHLDERRLSSCRDCLSSRHASCSLREKRFAASAPSLINHIHYATTNLRRREKQRERKREREREREKKEEAFVKMR